MALSLRRALRFLLLPLLAVSLVRCIQVEQSTTLFPDGSGKVVMKIAFKKAMLDMAKATAKQFGQEDADPLKEFQDPGELEKNSEGIAAWAVSKAQEDGEWVRVSLTGYFEDINKVKIYSKEEGGGMEEDPEGEEKPEHGHRKTTYAFKYEKTETGGTLSMSDDVRNDMMKDAPGAEEGEDENPEMRKAMAKMMESMLAGLKMSFVVTVPGSVEESEGFVTKQGRTASIEIDAKTILAAAEGGKESEEAKKFQALKDAKSCRVTWKKNEVTEEEKTAFRKELEDAKAAWNMMLEESRSKKKK